MNLPLKYLPCLGLSILLLVLGCASDDSFSPIVPTPSFTDVDYYPLTVGRYAEYEVETIDYSLRAGADTNRYQLRERVSDSLVGVGGEIIYSLERYTRNAAEAPWQLDSVWTARRNDQRVVVVENNVPFVKLVFPFEDGLQWDGNALNSRPTLTYRLAATDSTLQQEIGPKRDSLLSSSRTVVQRQLETLVNDSVLTETYGLGIGLIFKKSRILQYCADEDCIGQQQVESGRLYRQTLINYGKE